MLIQMNNFLSYWIPISIYVYVRQTPSSLKGYYIIIHYNSVSRSVPGVGLLHSTDIHSKRLTSLLFTPFKPSFSSYQPEIKAVLQQFQRSYYRMAWSIFTALFADSWKQIISWSRWRQISHPMRILELTSIALPPTGLTVFISPTIRFWNMYNKQSLSLPSGVSAAPPSTNNRAFPRHSGDNITVLWNA